MDFDLLYVQYFTEWSLCNGWCKVLHLNLIIKYYYTIILALFTHFLNYKVM